MNARRTLPTTLASAAAALLLAAPTAHATSRDRFDLRAFDGLPVVTGSGWAMEGATAGELGGHLSLSVEVSDGTLPAPGQCEAAEVTAVVTPSPGETFDVDTTGELCSHFIDGTPTLNAYFGNRQVHYIGSHKRARVDDGMIAFSQGFLGAQASVGLSVRW